MKLRTLIKIAYEIISAESEVVLEEFRNDDGSFTPENYKAASELQDKYDKWMEAAERVIGVDIHKSKKPARKHRPNPAPKHTPKPVRRIVVLK